jgi:lipopolysaccharide/colanic/teichoic acid biosynthesis glycosyltransferase
MHQVSTVSEGHYVPTRAASVSVARPHLGAIRAIPSLPADPLLDAYHAALATRSYRVRRSAKRLIDIVGAGVLLVVLSPLLLLLTVSIRSSASGSSIFRQERLGRNGHVFRVAKFRSMYPDAEDRLEADESLRAAYVDNGYTLPLKVDPRVTPVGRFLRRTSLDEMPQLWNVLRGDMSLVGPRPVVPDELACYEQWQWAYKAVRPGMTGLWQVSGRNAIVYPHRAQLDATYVAGWSLWADVKILFRTIGAVCKGSGHPEEQHIEHTL